MNLNIDLHSHSAQSDGALRPSEVAARAHERGVDCWALSDHDALSGLPEAAAAAAALGMRFIAGVEVSVTHQATTVHVLGLNIDPDYVPLRDGLRGIRAARHVRARRLAARLEECGVPGALEGALREVNNPDLIGRVHFARFLVQSGVCQSLREAFERFLGDGRKACVPVAGASLEEAVGWIRGAGGKAVIAHPARYRCKPAQRKALFGAFKDLGGQGIEVVTPSHTPDQCRQYARLAREYDFEASCGSDFHAPGAGRADLGGLSALPDGLTPIWRGWGVDPSF